MEFSKNFVCETREYSSYDKHVAAPVFRKVVHVTGEIVRAEILICGLGFYDLFINGKRITKGQLAPYISNPDQIIYYDHYNLHPYMNQGENVIGIMLGDGFQNSKTRQWEFVDNVFNSAPKLALSCTVEDELGMFTFGAGDFRCKKGPITFNDLRCGVFYDKRMEEKGWNEPGFCEDDGWHTPILADVPRGKAKLCEAEPIVVTKELTPVKVYRGGLVDYEMASAYVPFKKPIEEPQDRCGGWIYDFGENNAGIFRLKIKGTKGQRISIQCAEKEKEGKLDYNNLRFYPEGYVQRDIYIVGGDEEEIFEPMFTYHGFRYLYITGITQEQATEELLTYLVMSSDLKSRGYFSCSNDTANRIYDIAHRSDNSNFYYFPTDCPHREKNGWTGDAAVSAEHMVLTMEVENSWNEWLRNVRCAQSPEGKIPCIVPSGHWGYEWGSGPAWDTVLFTLPYVMYRYRGKTNTIHENAHAMMRYLEYIGKQRNEKGLLELGLGDWLPVDKSAADYDVPLEFTDSVMTYDMCRMAVVMFGAVGLALQQDYARKLQQELYQAIRCEYVESDSMTIKSRCQSAQALGIYYDIFTEEEKHRAFEVLMDILREKDYQLDTGFLGLRVIFHVLAEFGESELAWHMITKKEFPSYGWYVKKGYTTLPEHFIRNESGSHNHHFFGDVIQWFMRYPAGLRVENAKKVIIKPCFLEALSYAEARHELPDGEVKVLWEREADKIILHFTCPPEVECDVEVDQEICIVKREL